MSTSCRTPTVAELAPLAEVLSRWQADPWAGHLHPGDLGWHSSVGADQMAKDLRVWEHDGAPAAIGMLDGSDVLRLAVDPALAHDRAVADRVAADMDQTSSGLFSDAGAVVEARGATALRASLTGAGWLDDDPWTPLTLDLTAPLDLGRLRVSGLRVVELGPERVADWAGVHWAAFRGTPFDEEARTRTTGRLAQIMSGPFADRAHSLIGYDGHGAPVAVTTVWTAGEGRPGLIEPLGVHREHHGEGYGVAITLAAARALQEGGASSAAVVAQNANPAALAVYLSAGFSTRGQVTDLRRP